MHSNAVYKQRRDQLIKALHKQFPDQEGVVLICGGFESKRHRFRQDSSMYYLSGIEEPGSLLLITQGGATALYVPRYKFARDQWVASIGTSSDPKKHGVEEIRHLGEACAGYTAAPECTAQTYAQVLEELSQVAASGKKIFVAYQQPHQRRVFDQLCTIAPELAQAMVDSSQALAALRRVKSRDELEQLYEAVDCTMQAQEAVALRIEPGIHEYQLQAAAEFIFTEGGGRAAYPTIVGSGKNSTVLHYDANRAQLKEGDLVVVDCGAEINYYCADITRTYPVSGTFTDRQREVYDMVLGAQQYIADLAQPGYWLQNKEQPDKSLHHLAIEYFEEQGYAEYFPHAIGHFLGLDVHDVGDKKAPLQEGDVITIEPGLYIPKESLGIRIEDNYWITENGAVCVSEELPRDSYEVEQMMAAELDDESFL